MPRQIQFIRIEARTFCCSFYECYFPGPGLRRGRRLGIRLTKNAPLCLCLTEPSELDEPWEQWPKPMIGILVGDTSGNTLRVAALIFKELDGYYERATCCEFQWSLYRERDRRPEHVDFHKKTADSVEMMEFFSTWIREETERKTIRIG